MTLDWKDPHSIAAFYAVFPARHGPLIAWKAKFAPQFADAIARARQIVRPQQERKETCSIA